MYNARYMNTIIPFIVQHWLVFAVLVVLIIAAIVVEIRLKAGGPSRRSAAEVVQLINQDNALIVDTRGQADFKKGHITGAVNILPSDLQNSHKKLEKRKQDPIIIVCANGTQAGALAGKLNKQGYPDVHYLAGGMSSWKAEHLPTKKAK